MPIVSQGAAAGQMSSALWAATIISGSGDSPLAGQHRTALLTLGQGLTSSSHQRTAPKHSLLELETNIREV